MVSRGGAAVARRAHNPKVRSSNLLPATVARPVGPRFFGPIAPASRLWLVAHVPYKDPERRREYGRRWMRSNPEKAREAMRRWRKEHPDEHAADTRAFYSRHREDLAAYFADYRRTHRHVRQASEARRRGRKLAAVGSYTATEWLDLQQTWASFRPRRRASRSED